MLRQPVVLFFYLFFFCNPIHLRLARVVPSVSRHASAGGRNGRRPKRIRRGGGKREKPARVVTSVRPSILWGLVGGSNGRLFIYLFLLRDMQWRLFRWIPGEPINQLGSQ